MENLKKQFNEFVEKATTREEFYKKNSEILTTNFANAEAERIARFKLTEEATDTELNQDIFWEEKGIVLKYNVKNKRLTLFNKNNFNEK